jgi:hypothetical protein
MKKVGAWGGWLRLWLVAALTLGVPSGLIAFDMLSRGFFDVPTSAQVNALPDNGPRRAAIWEAVFRVPDAKYCSRPTMIYRFSEFSGGYVTCRNRLDYSLSRAIAFGLLPGVILWVIGWTIAWVWRGFRRPKPA